MIERAASSASVSYTLLARLGRAPLSGTVWSINSAELSDSAAVPVSFEGQGGIRQEVVCRLRVIGRKLPAIENTLELTVVVY